MLSFPHLEFGCPVGVGWVGHCLRGWPCWSLGSCADLVSRSCIRYGLEWPENLAYGGTTKITNDRPRGLAAQGVMSDLAT